MNQHIVKAYDGELATLHQLIQQMGALTLTQIQQAMESLVGHNRKLAEEVISRDNEVNQLETKVDALATRILALRQPVASDLRTVVAAFKISNQVERIADYASNIAKRSLLLNDFSHAPSVEALVSLAKTPLEMLEKALHAFATYDVELALSVWRMDRDVDDQYHAYLLNLFDNMIMAPQNVTPCVQLLFAAKNIERIGDQASNVAEAVYTMVTGKPFKESDIK